MKSELEFSSSNWSLRLLFFLHLSLIILIKNSEEFDSPHAIFSLSILMHLQGAFSLWWALQLQKLALFSLKTQGKIIYHFNPHLEVFLWMGSIDHYWNKVKFVLKVLFGPKHVHNLYETFKFEIQKIELLILLLAYIC